MPTKATSKPGSKSVDPASKGSNFANISGGNPGKSMPQKPIPGPSSPGQPPAMKKALAKKTVKGGDATGFAGLVR